MKQIFIDPIYNIPIVLDTDILMRSNRGGGMQIADFNEKKARRKRHSIPRSAICIPPPLLDRIGIADLNVK